MDNKIEVFKNEQFGEIRTALIENEPWFVAIDVCRALEIGNSSQAISRLDADEKMITLISNEGNKRGNPNMTVVNEPGLYTLILSSRKPEAKAFKRWITHDVIPMIRKTGGYMTDSLLERIQKEPAVIVEFAQALILEKNRVKTLECELNTAKPKADYYDAFINPDDCTNIRTTAKELKIPERKFVQFLLREKYLFRSPSGQLLPYNKDSNAGLFIVRDFVTYCYKEDFDIDKRIIRRAAESQNPEDKTLMWFCRPHGTHCLNENQVFIQGTRDHNTFRFYAEQTYDECVARVIVPKAVKRGKVFGDVFEINYREQAANVAQNSVAPDHDRLTFADGFVLEAPCRSSFDAAMALIGEHGGVKTHQTLPKDADALVEVLSKQKSRRDRLPEADRTEVLSPLPVAELRKYEAVKKAHPDALVCFAQNGYFELYGKDAEKAAPLLGTKLLEKKVRGKPSMPVTGFRESAWVAGSHKLWKSGADVFLSKDGETFKELKAADYIPVGATLNVDGIKCRIDAVDFAADEVRLTNIEDKNRPIRFSESIEYIRSYVEDAGTAIYDTIPKKPAARESIRDKLKSAQKAQPSHTPKPQKNKGKDMVL